MKRIVLFVFGLICFFAFIRPIVQFSQTPTPQATPKSQTSEIDLVHFGDLIDVDFEGGSEYDWRGAVSADGMLDGLDVYERIPAVCRSETDIGADIARVYGKILRDPKITVRIVDRSNRAVARLDGAVKNAMRFRLQRSVRLRELIIAAGGLTDDASGEISIVRPAALNCMDRAAASSGEVSLDPNGARDNGTQRMRITISELLTGKEPADPLILSGDLITVDRATPIYIIGAVNNPRPIYTHSGMTLLRAIATAGGLSKAAVSQKVTIYRRDGLNTTVIQADFEKIKKGGINDVDLQAFDIIEVAFKGRVQRKYPPRIAAGDKKDGNSDELPLHIID